MKKLVLIVALVCIAALAFAEVSDTVWKAVLHKVVVVEKNDGSEVSGELSAYDPSQIVVIKADGTPVVVDRVDVKSVKVQTPGAAGGTQAAATPAPAAPAPAPAAPATAAAPAAAKWPKYHAVFNVNPIGIVLSSILAEGFDFWADFQFPVAKFLAIGVEPEVLLGRYSGFGVYGGLLVFPLGNAPEGLFIRGYGGAGIWDGYLFWSYWGTVGWQFIWGKFVFTPEIGYGNSGFRWALDIGLAL